MQEKKRIKIYFIVLYLATRNKKYRSETVNDSAEIYLQKLQKLYCRIEELKESRINIRPFKKSNIL